MDESLEKFVKVLLREMVPRGAPNSSQRIARSVLADLLQAMWAKNPTGNAPATVRGCVDIAEVTAQTDDPDFMFEYDPRLLDGVWFERIRAHA
jgi:hypothetical protein